MENMRDDARSIQATLLAEIHAVAEEEHRAAGDVLRDVIERGSEERRWERVLAFGAAQAKKLGLTEADVPRLMAESRRERHQVSAPLTAAEAIERILEQRKENVLPKGTTIRELMAYGRA
jgi:hypothetical protein